jgi:GNAT superfamily N-acetyltransferase
MKISINNLNLMDKTLFLFKEIFWNTSYFKTDGVKEEWLKIINEGGYLFIAEEKISGNDEVLAFALCDKYEDTFVIFYAGVRENYRNRGIWRLVFGKIVNFAKEKSYRYVGVENSKELFPLMSKFLTKEGFKEIDRIKIENGAESVTYLKDLNEI